MKRNLSLSYTTVRPLHPSLLYTTQRFLAKPNLHTHNFFVERKMSEDIFIVQKGFWGAGELGGGGNRLEKKNLRSISKSRFF